jgi:hypothetical protein
MKVSISFPEGTNSQVNLPVLYRAINKSPTLAD